MLTIFIKLPLTTSVVFIKVPNSLWKIKKCYNAMTMITNRKREREREREGRERERDMSTYESDIKLFQLQQNQVWADVWVQSHTADHIWHFVKKILWVLYEQSLAQLVYALSNHKAVYKKEKSVSTKFDWT